LISFLFIYFLFLFLNYFLADLLCQKIFTCALLGGWATFFVSGIFYKTPLLGELASWLTGFRMKKPRSAAFLIPVTMCALVFVGSLNLSLAGQEAV